MSGEDKPLYNQENPAQQQPAYAVPPPQQYPPPQQAGYASPPPQYPQGAYPPQGGYPTAGGYAYAPGYQQVPQGVPMGAPQVPVLAQDIRFRETPIVCTCPYCGTNGPTRQEYVNGLLTWLSVGGLCLIGCWLGCCLIPMAVDACKDVEHKCGSCQRVIGVYRRVN